MRLMTIPTTVVTGFLRAGNTTPVNQILDATRPMQIGIVVNGFGEVGIDGQLIAADERAVIEINNGCVCCTVHMNLVASVRDLHRSRRIAQRRRIRAMKRDAAGRFAPDTGSRSCNRRGAL
ncbi:GTP-binding protein [Paraburkholderia caribensis]|uniref:GTP-binding protein n=1 Tax=Paraburkholderia caribensis TaxID=75105 RepID=UPI003AB0DB02